jgi:hypothetical protein
MAPTKSLGVAEDANIVVKIPALLKPTLNIIKSSLDDRTEANIFITRTLSILTIQQLTNQTQEIFDTYWGEENDDPPNGDCAPTTVIRTRMQHNPTNAL